MNKIELVNAISEKASLTKKVAELSLNAITETIAEELKKGNKVQLIGFGAFEVRKRASRKGRNPQTNEEIIIPEMITPVFKPGKALKDIINK